MDDPGPAILLAAEAANSSTDTVSLILKIVLLFVLILINAFFAMSEIAVVSMSEMKIKKLADADNKKAKKLLKLTFDSAGFLATIQVGVTLAGFLTSASASQIC